MRRIASLAFAIAVMMVATGIGISAQEATPATDVTGPPESVELAPGVVGDNLLFAEGAAEPTNYRLTFQPGVVYTVWPSQNLELVFVESGSLVGSLDGTVVVTALGDTGSGGEIVPAGTEYTMRAGQFIVLQPGMGGEIRNEGSEPASISIAGLTPAGAGAEMDGPVVTPQATPAG